MKPRLTCQYEHHCARPGIDHSGLRCAARHGGVLKADAAAVDAGDSGGYDVVLKFCNARMSRRVLAGKGAAGFGRPLIQASKTRRGRLFIVGVDAAKAQILTRLARGTTIRFSHTLDATYFEQLASERRVVRMSRGRPVGRFERKIGARSESLGRFCAVRR
jgi:phage terminase large subunit GpA-like protein